MIEFIPFKSEHLLLLDASEAQRNIILSHAVAGKLTVPVVDGWDWTGIYDGRVVGCAGLIPHWNNRAVAWALFSPTMPKRAWPTILHKMRNVFKIGPRRIEASVEVGFGQGCRLAHYLGFAVEGVLKAYGPDGKDHFMYALVKP